MTQGEGLISDQAHEKCINVRNMTKQQKAIFLLIMIQTQKCHKYN